MIDVHGIPQNKAIQMLSRREHCSEGMNCRRTKLLNYFKYGRVAYNETAKAFYDSNVTIGPRPIVKVIGLYWSLTACSSCT